MKALPSIVLITCWYGSYPWYLPYFMHSCEYNPSVDFVIITDNVEIIPNKPDNVKIIYKTLEDIKTIASERLGFTVKIETPYKLNDIKPAYAFLFPEIVNEYDFWGYADIDMVYGNIRNFMTDEILSNNDLISCREEMTTGTFLLFRNNGQMNTLFMESRDYKHVFTNPVHFCFDECNFLYSPLRTGKSIFDFPERIQSMTYLAKKGVADGKFRAFFNCIIVQGISNKIKWDNGLIIHNGVEYMLYDLIRFKYLCGNKNVLFPIPEIFYFDIKGVCKEV